MHVDLDYVRAMYAFDVDVDVHVALLVEEHDRQTDSDESLAHASYKVHVLTCVRMFIICMHAHL